MVLLSMGRMFTNVVGYTETELHNEIFRGIPWSPRIGDNEEQRMRTGPLL